MSEAEPQRPSYDELVELLEQFEAAVAGRVGQVEALVGLVGWPTLTTTCMHCCLIDAHHTFLIFPL
jgi:hypothetical protein